MKLRAPIILIPVIGSEHVAVINMGCFHLTSNMPESGGIYDEFKVELSDLFIFTVSQHSQVSEILRLQQANELESETF